MIIRERNLFNDRRLSELAFFLITFQRWLNDDETIIFFLLTNVRFLNLRVKFFSLICKFLMT